MTIKLFSAFFTADIGALRGTQQETSLESPVSWESTGKYFLPFGAVAFSSGTFEYSGAIQAMTDQLNALSGPINFDVQYNNLTNRVIISASAAPFELTFNSATQRTFGLKESYSSTQFVTGNKGPFFVWTASQTRRARDTFPFEVDAKIQERLSDSGIAYSIGRRDVEQRRDWEFHLEPQSNVFTRFSSSAEPYTYERFIKNLREGPTPFVLTEDHTGSLVTYQDREALYEMREQGMRFAERQAASTDQHEFWRIPVKTRLHFPTHADLKELPPDTICVLPIRPDVIYPLNGATGIILSGVLADEVVLSWSQDTGTNFYQVYFGTDPTPDIGELVKNTTENFLTQSASSSTDYFWRIDAVNDCGVTTNEVWSFTTAVSQCILPPDADFVSPVTGAVSVSLTLPFLSWSSTPNTTAYEVFFGLDSSPDAGEFLGTTAANVWFLSASHPLAPSSSYFWRIDSLNICGTSSNPEVWDFSTVPSGVFSPIIATGGTIVTGQIDNISSAIHTFDNVGTSSLIIVNQGVGPSGSAGIYDFLLVAGGGSGGGAGGFAHGGGGGAGGLITGSQVATASVIPVVVGAGGVSVDADPVNGENTLFDTFTSIAGGGGGGAEVTGNDGGSGGGGGDSGESGTTDRGLGTADQGFAGGSGIGAAITEQRAGGGGGGHANIGINAVINRGGQGGSGSLSSLTGVGIFYAGGGGGAGSSNLGGQPGLGGGGRGGSTGGVPIDGEDGTDGLGGGGGGANTGISSSAGDGGSGVVILSYPLTDVQTVTSSWLPLIATGGSVVTTSIGGFDHAVHTFPQGSGSFVIADVGTSASVNFLIVAGGGGGHVAGGGAGGLLSGSITGLTASTLSVVVGAGGPGAFTPARAPDGESSMFDGVTAIFGGGGGGGAAGPDGGDGGSGGGGGADVLGTNGTPGSGVVGQGFAGGLGFDASLSAQRGYGSGGGASEVGTDAIIASGGDGGDGFTSSITGAPIIYAGGAGGHPGGSGGAGGGGDAAVDGTDGLGGGGGGGLGSNDGGDGVVIVRYPIEEI